MIFAKFLFFVLILVMQGLLVDFIFLYSLAFLVSHRICGLSCPRINTDSIIFILFLLARCPCAVNISKALGLETGVYVISVFLMMLIALSRDMEQLVRVTRFLNSDCDVRRKLQMIFFKPPMY